MLAGIVHGTGGCRTTAEIGFVRIADQIDALEGMGLRPIPFAVGTRLTGIPTLKEVSTYTYTLCVTRPTSIPGGRRRMSNNEAPELVSRHDPRSTSRRYFLGSWIYRGSGYGGLADGFVASALENRAVARTER